MTDSATPDIGGRIAIISDVHGNRHALEAVRRAQRQAGVTRTWCLGDMVGYGAHPNECLRACVHVSERCIAGNHDLAAAGRVPINVFSPWARTAIEWTRTQLDRNALDRLAGLEPLDTDGDVALFHASPRDPVWEYVLDGDGDAGPGAGVGGGDAEADPMYDQAVAIVLQNKKASISLVQRHLRIGYNRAARLLEQMEKSGLVSSMATNGNRDLLIPKRDE